MNCNVSRVVLLIVAGLSFAWHHQADASDGYRLPPTPNAWRGRMVSRRGLFNVDRARWGNGITPTGGQVLISGFNTFGQVAPMFWGGGIPNPAASGNGTQTPSNEEPLTEISESTPVADLTRLDPVIEKKDQRLHELRELKAELCAMLAEKPKSCTTPATVPPDDIPAPPDDALEPAPTTDPTIRTPGTPE